MGRVTEALSYWTEHKRSPDDRILMTHYEPNQKPEDSKIARNQTRIAVSKD